MMDKVYPQIEPGNLTPLEVTPASSPSRNMPRFAVQLHLASAVIAYVLVLLLLSELPREVEQALRLNGGGNLHATVAMIVGIAALSAMNWLLSGRRLPVATWFLRGVTCLAPLSLLVFALFGRSG